MTKEWRRGKNEAIFPNAVKSTLKENSALSLNHLRSEKFVSLRAALASLKIYFVFDV